MKPQDGFTLIEMALVLMIAGLLLGGLLVPLGAQLEQRRIAATEKNLDEIKDALTGYAIINGQLPCPAIPGLAAGQINAGISRTPPCTGASSAGVLPWATLGVSESDAWGNRYTYRVTDYFADGIGSTFGSGCTPSPAPTQATFALCTAGNLDVLSAATGGTKIALGTAAIIISHGKNGAGAYTPQGLQLTISSNPDERENSDGSANNNYVSHTATPSYDDLVAWISTPILFNRMVAAGKLP
ncbi:MAG: prepilin-type N-terminal cleavage/methylation domain-containing protein [Pseudomonadota bacterium]